jgi:hypothetical protein
VAVFALPDELTPGSIEVLDALALVSGEPRDRLDVSFRSATGEGDTSVADQAHVVAEIEAVIRHVQLAPVGFDSKPPVVDPLKALLEAPPPVSHAEFEAWRRLRKTLPIRIIDVDRAPVMLPAMPEAQEAAWSVILDLEDELDCHWSLIGGQMVTFICAEYGHTIHRATDDGDIVLGVWLDRGAFRRASRLLDERGFIEDKTSDGYGYRYRRAKASIDLLLPEEISRQEQIPTTTTGRPGLEVPGGNQALIRSERAPVQLGNRTGFIRRPNLLGAIVAKAAAAQADTRDPDRHREDLAVLGQIALTTGAYRAMRNMSNDKDRKRLRNALQNMPETHSAWRQIAEPTGVQTALNRLASAPTR